MTPEQTQAFNQAANTSVSEVANGILTILFVMTILWAVILLIGKLKALTRAQDIDVIQMTNVTLRVLAVVVMVLILVNV